MTGAHVDHGKNNLGRRMLKQRHLDERKELQERTDSNDLKERGITILLNIAVAYNGTESISRTQFRHATS